MITRLTIFNVALWLGGCSSPTTLQRAADEGDAHPAAEGTRRTAATIADDFLAFVDSSPKPDAFDRHLAMMAGELTTMTGVAAPGAAVACRGHYESAGCWHVSCECNNLRACATVSTWCGTIVGEERGRSCAKASTSGCL